MHIRNDAPPISYFESDFLIAQHNYHYGKLIAFGLYHFIENVWESENLVAIFKVKPKPMSKLFNIEGFCFSATHKAISVNTDKDSFLVDMAKFEKWVDNGERRKDKKSEIEMSWEYYYLALAEHDLYDYLILTRSGDVFGDIKEAIEEIVATY